jgi:hypothetical protein
LATDLVHKPAKAGANENFSEFSMFELKSLANPVVVINEVILLRELIAA